jgi:serine/threonine protein kinase
VCDFGLSKGVKKANPESITNESTMGSPQYAAPELPLDNHTEKVDVFSFAIM